MAAGRRADTERRRQRVLAALDAAAKAGEEISVSAIARCAAVDRTLPLPAPRPSRASPRPRGPAACLGGRVACRYRARPQADLLAAHGRSACVAA